MSKYDPLFIYNEKRKNSLFFRKTWHKLERVNVQIFIVQWKFNWFSQFHDGIFLFYIKVTVFSCVKKLLQDKLYNVLQWFLLGMDSKLFLFFIFHKSDILSHLKFIFSKLHYSFMKRSLTVNGRWWLQTR